MSKSSARSCNNWCTARVRRTEPTVLYADAALLVIDKPAGLLAVPGRGPDKQDCVSARIQHLHADALVVHRLDMATSGLMLMARGKPAQQTLSRAFANREVHKTYQALIQGDLPDPPDHWGQIDLPILLDWPQRPRRIISALDGKPSTTRWRVLDRSDPAHTRVELEPVTGRSHQLRVHMLAMGHPILGDPLYLLGDSADASDRLLLHACRMAFAHPVTGQAMQFDSLAPF
ncbi:MAG: RluA family pseudouridine synthase [Rhodoferax sp.]|nr:RluA family pseudouridine synthase [Rhodoferax sp.]